MRSEFSRQTNERAAGTGAGPGSAGQGRGQLVRVRKRERILPPLSSVSACRGGQTPPPPGKDLHAGAGGGRRLSLTRPGWHRWQVGRRPEGGGPGARPPARRLLQGLRKEGAQRKAS